MQDLVTLFFAPPGTGECCVRCDSDGASSGHPGADWSLAIQCRAPDHPAPTREALMVMAQALTASDCDRLLTLASLEAQHGPFLMLLLGPTDGRGETWVDLFTTAGYVDPPTAVLVLTPGLGERVLSLSQTSRLGMSVDAHLIVPVNALAQSQLEQLRVLLSGLQPDLKRLLLDTLGRPGLEERVARLEDAARAGPPAIALGGAPAQSSVGRAGGGFAGLVPVLSLAGAFLGALTGLFGWGLYRDQIPPEAQRYPLCVRIVTQSPLPASPLVQEPPAPHPVDAADTPASAEPAAEPDQPHSEPPSDAVKTATPGAH